jgi:uncharacterized tellurite resistance protein B-like protein
MGILEWLGGFARNDRGVAGDTESVRRIVAELDKLDPDHARHLAAFAYLLSRVAGADRHFSGQETRKMTEIVQKLGHVSEEQAILVTEIAKHQNKLFGGTENFLVSREFRQIATDEQRRDLLDCLFAVSAADSAISGEEESQIWQIASELGFSHSEYVQARLAYSGKRTVLGGNLPG